MSIGIAFEVLLRRLHTRLQSLRTLIDVLGLLLEDRQKFFQHEIIIGKMFAVRQR